VQQPRNFGKQGNCYSSYKGHTTYKFLVGVAPNGSIVYLSDVYEGSISDKEIVKRSGFLDHLHPGDVVMADRGFNIEDLLMPRKSKLIIPPFWEAGTNLHHKKKQRLKTLQNTEFMLNEPLKD